MATIILHAGMPKAGSSAIQRWLGSLQDQPIPGLTPAVARIKASGVSVVPATGGHCNSGIVVEEMRRAGNDSRDVVHRFAAGLDELANQHACIVLSGEALSQPFWKKDQVFLRALDDLGQSHNVIVLYYVRPQDTALEAAWRQWGFRTGFSPARYVRHRAEQMDYLDTLTSTAQEATNLDFRMRPFRRDLLTDGDVVMDFAQHGLSLRLSAGGGRWESNIGLPLDVVNLLAEAPAGLLGDSPHENRHFSRIKAALSHVPIPTSENADAGRAILRAWAYEAFEEQNREVIRRLGWNTDHFIPRGPDVEGGLSRLDEHWRARATDAELAAFFGLVASLTPCSEPRKALTRADTAGSRQLAQMRSELAVERRRRASAEQKLDDLRSRRAVKAALRVATLIGKALGRR